MLRCRARVVYALPIQTKSTWYYVEYYIILLFNKINVFPILNVIILLRTDAQSQAAMKEEPGNIVNGNEGSRYVAPQLAPLVNQQRVFRGRSKEDAIYQQALNSEKIMQASLAYDCPKTCQFGGVCGKMARNATEVFGVRQMLFGGAGGRFSSQVRKKWLFNALTDNVIRIKNNDGNSFAEPHFRYFIQHQEYCLRAFQSITGLSKQSISRARSRVRRNIGSHTDAIPAGVKAGGSVRNNDKDVGMAMAWLKGLSDRVGQYIPNVSETRLPFNTKKLVWEYYCAEMRIRGVGALGYSGFCDKWNHHPDCGRIRLAKKKGAFTQCTTCSNFATEMTKAKDNVQADGIKARWNNHVDDVMACRRIYYDNRDRAFARPEETLCIIADIMDQKKNHIPHFVRSSKKHGKLQGVKQCVMGVKIHGHGTEYYIAQPRVGTGGGSNFTIECINRCIRHLAGQLETRGKFLPPRLYLQMDNCAGDNKNYAIMGWVNFLVKMRVFETVEVGYLPVGHTHEDIDQHFSVLSRHLKRHNALSKSAYEAVVLGAFSHILDKPRIEYVNVKRAFKEWIEQPGVLYDKRKGILGIRYLRVTSYGNAKLLMTSEMEKEATEAQRKGIDHLTCELRRLREAYLEAPRDAPGIYVLCFSFLYIPLSCCRMYQQIHLQEPRRSMWRSC